MNYGKHTNGSRAVNYRGAQSRKMSHDTLLQRARCDSSLKSIAFGALRGTLENVSDRMPSMIVLAFMGMMVWGLASAFGNYLDLPDVHESYLTGECVRVVEADGTKKACPASLPDRYHLVWVE